MICDGLAAAVCTTLTRTVTGCRSAQPPLLDVVSVTDPSAWGPVYGTGQLCGGSGARRSRQACSRLGYRFEVDLDADLPGDQEPAAVQGRFQLRPQASRSRVPLAVKRPGGRPWGATWPRYSACRLTGRVMPQMVSSPASMPRVPCQPAVRLEREAVGGGGWCRSRHVNRPRTLVSMKWRADEGHLSVAGVDLLLVGSRKLGPAGRGRWHGRAPIPHGHPPCRTHGGHRGAEQEVDPEASWQRAPAHSPES